MLGNASKLGTVVFHTSYGRSWPPGSLFSRSILLNLALRSEDHGGDRREAQPRSLGLRCSVSGDSCFLPGLAAGATSLEARRALQNAESVPELGAELRCEASAGGELVFR